jgi:hypothetical protein
VTDFWILVRMTLHYNLLGHAAFLEFFDVTFRGKPDYEAILTAKTSFPGTCSD